MRAPEMPRWKEHALDAASLLLLKLLLHRSERMVLLFDCEAKAEVEDGGQQRMRGTVTTPPQRGPHKCRRSRVHAPFFCRSASLCW